jgi:hypothetical protein
VRSEEAELLRDSRGITIGTGNGENRGCVLDALGRKELRSREPSVQGIAPWRELCSMGVRKDESPHIVCGANYVKIRRAQETDWKTGVNSICFAKTWASSDRQNILECTTSASFTF